MTYNELKYLVGDLLLVVLIVYYQCSWCSAISVVIQLSALLRRIVDKLVYWFIAFMCFVWYLLPS